MMVGEWETPLSHLHKRNEDILMEVIHFNSAKERMAYIRGGFEEIIPIEAKVEVEKTEEKPKKAKKSAKKAKKED